MKLLTGMLLGVLVFSFSTSSHAVMGPGLYYAMKKAHYEEKQREWCRQNDPCWREK